MKVALGNLFQMLYIPLRTHVSEFKLYITQNTLLVISAYVPRDKAINNGNLKHTYVDKRPSLNINKSRQGCQVLRTKRQSSAKVKVLENIIVLINIHEACENLTKMHSI